MSSLLPYTHRISDRARRITIKVEPSGEVVVVTPKRYSASQMVAFVTQNQDWIVRTREKLLHKKANEYGETATTLHIFGKKYTKNVVVGTQDQYGVWIKGERVSINALTEKQVPALIERFFKNTAEEYIVPRTYQLAEKMDISFKNISLRQQKTRWGSCSSRGNLNFNWRLVHAPPAVIDYVIIHELAHRTHMNHSARFWALVAKFDPEYTQHRRWLSSHGMSVG
ncbi:MAG TPA: SprT family zinc-dependent metalloprotease [Patescibacteria group bacterium]